MARTVFVFVLANMVPVSALAGVVVTQNISPGATSWPGSPIIQSVTNPASQTSVGENFNGGDAGGTWQFIEGSATNSARFYRSHAPLQ